MDTTHKNIRLYTSQSKVVVDKLIADERHTVKSEFIKEKYGETSHVFLQAYSWYTNEAKKIVEKPKDADSAIWTFFDVKYLDYSADARIMRLNVPISQVVFFRMSDWNKILNLRFVGNESETAAYYKKLKQFNVTYEGDVYTTAFYPHLKAELVNSWKRLFDYDQEIKKTEILPFADMQAGLWEIKLSWVDQFID
ncbi:hypothetical protein NRIC_01200 [Enterococcus florum]|uniref:DUF3841 domain-containing protein n=1 Tax=Enterococcus florum TaxID=2480627 RepID=A0A4V0WP10_9ENTE|nr:DUF3841 domain-containing protein [Enterococcus florum]GCF92229.1 hypothetical protein NRIC_01200 [Enterococcus florum]